MLDALLSLISQQVFKRNRTSYGSRSCSSNTNSQIIIACRLFRSDRFESTVFRFDIEIYKTIVFLPNYNLLLFFNSNLEISRNNKFLKHDKMKIRCKEYKCPATAIRNVRVIFTQKSFLILNEIGNVRIGFTLVL